MSELRVGTSALPDTDQHPGVWGYPEGLTPLRPAHAPPPAFPALSPAPGWAAGSHRSLVHTEAWPGPGHSPHGLPDPGPWKAVTVLLGAGHSSLLEAPPAR